LNKRVEDPNIWSNPAQAQKIMRQRQALERSIAGYNKLEREFDDAMTLIELGTSEDDQASIDEGEAALKQLAEEARRQEVEALLSGEADGNDTYLEVHAGAGGTESQDWAEMLSRMYARWAEDHDYKVSIVEQSAGEEAGIKSATLIIKGENAYGWLKTESGVHRLVRISPYDSNARRHTSFASVWVFPVVDENIEIEIKESDCRVDTYRASGAGGQHVNTTDSAVRITHTPTGIVVASQQERSQIKNRGIAWAMLKSRLYELELKKREEKANAAAAAKTEIGWGHQIRSYVLQPYQLVKDLRTGTQSSDPQKVLDGDIDSFIESALAQKVKGGGPAKVEDID
jgi:peptide chain release factor 2